MYACSSPSATALRSPAIRPTPASHRSSSSDRASACIRREPSPSFQPFACRWTLRRPSTSRAPAHEVIQSSSGQRDGLPVPRQRQGAQGWRPHNRARATVERPAVRHHQRRPDVWRGTFTLSGRPPDRPGRCCEHGRGDADQVAVSGQGNVTVDRFRALAVAERTPRPGSPATAPAPAPPTCPRAPGRAISSPISRVATGRSPGRAMSARARPGGEHRGDRLVHRRRPPPAARARSGAASPPTGDGTDRVGDAPPGDIGRRAVHRLEQPGPVAERGRGQQAQRARQHRRLVAQDVAEQVLGEQHVERRRIARRGASRRNPRTGARAARRELLRPTRVTVSRQSCDTSSTLALSTDVTRPRRSARPRTRPAPLARSPPRS